MHPTAPTCRRQQYRLQTAAPTGRAAPWFIALALLWGGTASASTAEVARRFQAQQQAVQQYDLLTRAAATANAPERMQSPATNALLAVIADQRRLLDDIQYTAQDLPELLVICDSAKRTQQALGALGMRTAQPAGPSAGPEQFLPQYTVVLPFVIRCAARLPPVLAAQLDALPGEQLPAQGRQGLATLREGMNNVYLSALIDLHKAAEDAPASAALRRALVEAMDETAPVYAGMLPLARREQIARQLDTSLQVAPAHLQEPLRRVLQAYRGTGCEGLCRF